MVLPANSNRSELHGVVLAPQRGCGQEKAQNLRIGLGGPACEEIERQKNQHTAKQAVEQIESASAQAHSEKEQLSLGTEYGEGPGEGTMHQVDPSCVRHRLSRDSRFRNPISRKEQGHEVYSDESHS